MVKLKNDSRKIKAFIIEGLEKFSNEVKPPAMMGVYCCPWSGWITLNFNINYPLSEAYYSCPDFEFVEYDLIEFEHWQEEYESRGVFQIDDQSKYDLNSDEGDEALNKLLFDYLKGVILNLKKDYSLPPILVQLLDSNCCEKIE